MQVDSSIQYEHLAAPLARMFALAAEKVRQLDRSWDASRGAPVFTIEGRYTSKGWTEWTQGFQFGMALLAFDATGELDLLELGRQRTLERMSGHVTHTGVHDHGFNNLSTYGNLRRLMREGRIGHNPWELRFYEMALKASSAVQAARWAGVRVDQPSPRSAQAASLGYIYSFNGPHSLFVDTMRTLRILSLGWQLGHSLSHENDRKADLLKRAVLHALATSQFIVFHGDTPHTYDVRGRTAHEAIFNRSDGSFRNRSTQQGYSPFSTWTRGLAWAMLGFAEQLELLTTIDDARFEASTGLNRDSVLRVFEETARATCDHYIDDCSARDGIVYWDDGAPGLAKLGDWRGRDAEPFNDHEPVDSSASAIAAQGLLRLGRYLGASGARYTQAGLSVARTLLSEAYLARTSAHEGLLLHSIYHRPNGWDHIPAGRKVPCGEASMWGDYHLLELGVMIDRLRQPDKPYLAFFDQA
jgi:hypothetical protein